MTAAFISAMLLVASFTIDLSLVYVTKQRAQVIADAANLAAVEHHVRHFQRRCHRNGRGDGQERRRDQRFRLGDDHRHGRQLPARRRQHGPADGHRQGRPVRLGSALDQHVDRDRDHVLDIGRPAAATASRRWSAPVNIYNYAVVKGSTCTVKAKTYLYACGTAKIDVSAVKVGYIQLFEALYICSTAAVTPSLGSFTFGASISDIYASDTRLSTLKSKLLGMMLGWSFGLLPPVNPTVLVGRRQDLHQHLGHPAAVDPLRNDPVYRVDPDLPRYRPSADPNCTSPTTISGQLHLQRRQHPDLRFGGATSSAGRSPSTPAAAPRSTSPPAPRSPSSSRAACSTTATRRSPSATPPTISTTGRSTTTPDRP